MDYGNDLGLWLSATPSNIANPILETLGYLDLAIIYSHAADEVRGSKNDVREIRPLAFNETLGSTDRLRIVAASLKYFLQIMVRLPDRTGAPSRIERRFAYDGC